MTSKDFHRTIRGLMNSNDYSSIPSRVVEYINSSSDYHINIDTLNSIISGLSHLEEWNTVGNFFKASMLVDELIKDVSPETMKETTITSLIRFYCSEYLEFDKIQKYVDLMITNGIPLKTRTFSPIFQLLGDVKDIHMAKTFYLQAVTNNINLTANDYINLMKVVQSHSDDYLKKVIIQDFAKNIPDMTEENYDKIRLIFLDNMRLTIDSVGNITPGEDFFTRLIDFQMPRFSIPSGTRNRILTQIELYMNKVVRNKGNLQTFGKFKKFIKDKDYNIVLDGANIGFFNQGSNSGKVINFDQIKTFVEYVISKGYNPLLVLHSRHFKSLSVSDKETVKSITNTCLVFQTPSGMDDDIFWLYSSIYKPNTFLITNDEIRNHVFYMKLDYLHEWKKYHIIKYDCVDQTVHFTIPSKFIPDTYFHYSTSTLVIPFIIDGEKVYHSFFI